MVSPRTLPLLIAFVVTVVAMSVFSYVQTQRTDPADRVIVYAPGHVSEVRSKLLDERSPDVRSVDEMGEHMTFGVTCLYSTVYLAAVSLVFGVTFVLVRRLTRGTPTI